MEITKEIPEEMQHFLRVPLQPFLTRSLFRSLFTAFLLTRCGDNFWEELPLDQPPPQSSLKLASQLRQIFERSGDTAEEEEDEDEELNSDEDGNLNLQRLPVFVYKLPVGKHSSFGDGYEGMETEVCKSVVKPF